jgi:rod shape-determining protein MreC
MAGFSAIFHKNRRFLNYAIIFAVFLLTTISSETARPFLGDLSTRLFYYPFFKLKDKMEGMRNLEEENRDLRRQLAEFSLQLSALQEAARENRRLREFIGFKPAGDFAVIPAKIISIFQQHYPISALINKGVMDGVRANQAVVNRFGLIGKVKETAVSSASIQFLTDPESAVAVRIADTDQMGTVRFTPEKGMMLYNLPADGQVKKGDLIITSGMGGIYPPGLAVARVDSVFPNQGDILKTVKLRPAVDFFKVNELYIIKGD